MMISYSRPQYALVDVVAQGVRLNNMEEEDNEEETSSAGELVVWKIPQRPNDNILQ